MKEMTKATTNMMAEEEKAESDAAAAASGAHPLSASASTSTSEPHPNGGAAQPAGRPSTAASASAAATPATGHPSAAHAHHAAPSEDTAAAPLSTSGPAVAHSSPSPSPPISTTTPPPTSSKKRSKMTPEQRAEKEKQDRERKSALEARVRMLTEKLTERLRPFVEAKNPGATGDPETVAWEAKMRREADDLKLESFGVELLHAIGTVYVTKASGFLKSRKFLGMWVTDSSVDFSSFGTQPSSFFQSWILVEVERERVGGEGCLGRDWQRVRRILSRSIPESN